MPVSSPLGAVEPAEKGAVRVTSHPGSAPRMDEGAAGDAFQDGESEKHLILSRVAHVIFGLKLLNHTGCGLFTSRSAVPLECSVQIRLGSTGCGLSGHQLQCILVVVGLLLLWA